MQAPTATQTEPVAHILVEGVSKRFGSFEALSNINMSIRKGEIAVVIGGSGAGKSTLLKVLIGLDTPTSGAIYVDGQNIVGLSDRRLTEVRKKFGMVFQYSALLDSMNVLDNVAFPLREHTKLSEKAIKERVLDKLELLELRNVEHRFPAELSGGMRKRVGLARALMLEPEILMYDEPTSGLDPITSRLVDHLIVDTRDRFGITSIVISHDMAGALRMADQIYLLSKGSLVTHGSPLDLVQGDNELAREFFESSGINAKALIAEHNLRRASRPPPASQG